MSAGLVYDENFQLWWLDTAPADPEAPTAAEITNGTNFTPYVPKDGVQPNVSNNRVNGGSLDTKFSAESMGTWTAALTVMMKRRLEDDSQDAWDTFGDVGVTGCWVMIPFGPAAVGVDAYVWPSVESGAPVLQSTAENEEQRFSTDWAARREPVFNATVAA